MPSPSRRKPQAQPKPDTNSLLKDLLRKGNQPTGPCRTGAFFATLPPEVRATVEVAAAEGVRGTSIGKVLARHGFPGAPPVDTINRHLKGICSCHRV